MRSRPPVRAGWLGLPQHPLSHLPVSPEHGHTLCPPTTPCSLLASDVGKAALRRADIFADESGDRWKPVAGAAGGIWAAAKCILSRPWQLVSVASSGCQLPDWYPFTGTLPLSK